MKVDELEKILLDKLDNGLLDGVVGNDFETGDYAKVTYRKIIKDGIPQVLRFGPDSKFFDNRETVRVPGNKSVDSIFETVAQKLGFLQKYGWLMSDPDARDYSALFKPNRK